MGAAVRYIKYDPNFAADDGDEDEDMGDDDDGDEDEEDG